MWLVAPFQHWSVDLIIHALESDAVSRFPFTDNIQCRIIVSRIGIKNSARRPILEQKVLKLLDGSPRVLILIMGQR
jgi:hypothetical protein